MWKNGMITHLFDGPITGNVWVLKVWVGSNKKERKKIWAG